MLKVISAVTLACLSACSAPADTTDASLSEGNASPASPGNGSPGRPSAGPTSGEAGPTSGEAVFLDDSDMAAVKPTLGFDPVSGKCGSNLVGLVRDFHDDHPDMEICAPEKGAAARECVHEKGIVAPTLGPDDKPVYAGDAAAGTLTTTSKASFDQWFRDTPGFNTSVEFQLAFTEEVDANGVKTFVFDSEFPPPGSPAGFFPGPGNYPPGGFFPIDTLDQDGFKMVSKLHPQYATTWYPHNYHFTFEFVTDFVYKGGEVFTFTGDDDVFVFINRQQVVDLGGIHPKMESVVDLDAESARIGLVKGESYPLHFFFAERHETASNFRIETSLIFLSCKTPRLK